MKCEYTRLKSIVNNGKWIFKGISDVCGNLAVPSTAVGLDHWNFCIFWFENWLGILWQLCADCIWVWVDLKCKWMFLINLTAFKLLSGITDKKRWFCRALNEFFLKLTMAPSMPTFLRDNSRATTWPEFLVQNSCKSKYFSSGFKIPDRN